VKRCHIGIFHVHVTLVYSPVDYLDESSFASLFDQNIGRLNASVHYAHVFSLDQYTYTGVDH
jgi:hypothetical protein